jgi:hypothetical protein
MTDQLMNVTTYVVDNADLIQTNYKYTYDYTYTFGPSGTNSNTTFYMGNTGTYFTYPTAGYTGINITFPTPDNTGTNYISPPQGNTGTNYTFPPPGYTGTNYIFPTTYSTGYSGTNYTLTSYVTGYSGTNCSCCTSKYLTNIPYGGTKIVPANAEDSITFETIENGDILVDFKRTENKTEYECGALYKESTLEFILRSNKNQFTMEPLDKSSIIKYTAVLMWS